MPERFVRSMKGAVWTFLACAAVTLAQVPSPNPAPANVVRRDVLTNASIVTLATAGFEEDFVIDLIACSRTNFDLTVEGLKALAKEGITQRIIRTMMAFPSVSEQSPFPLAQGPGPGESSRQKPMALAVTSRTPYSESESIFWGLFQHHSSVGRRGTENEIGPHLGAYYEKVALPRQPHFPKTAPARSAPQRGEP